MSAHWTSDEEMQRKLEQMAALWAEIEAREKKAVKAREGEIMARHRAWLVRHRAWLVEEDKRLREAREKDAARRVSPKWQAHLARCAEKARVAKERKLAKREWHAGVQRILDEVRRREEARSYCEVYEEACLPNPLTGDNV
jgi:hypothetical protein